MSIPIKATPFTFDIPGVTVLGEFVNNPTIVAGDCQVAKDGGAFVNTTVTPSVYNTRIVTITLSSNEMNADRLFVQLKDQDTVWQPVDILIQPEPDVLMAVKPTFIPNNLGGQISATRIEIIRGDAYDGNSWPKLSWTASQDITGKVITFTIREEDDFSFDPAGAPILQVTGVGAGTLAEISLSATNTNIFPLPIGSKQYNFDLEITHSVTSYQTIARGTVTVSLDQTRR